MADTVALKSRITPCGAPGDLHWNTPDDVVDVPVDLALELLRIGHAGFYEVLPSEVSEEAAQPAPEPEINPGYQDYSAEGFAARTDLTKARDLAKHPHVNKDALESTPEGQPKLQESIKVAAPPTAKKATARKAAARKA